MIVTEQPSTFSYWGSKVQMATWIVDRLPRHDHFVEACAGSAAVTAVKPPVAAETVNDVYGEVVNFFRVLRDPATAAELIDQVAFTPYASAEFAHAGTVLLSDAAPVERAWAFFVRMQMAVVPGRSGWSYGVQGASARKAHKPGRWASMPGQLRLAAARFRDVQVTDWDILELIERLDAPGVLIFVDPPYLPESRPSSLSRSSPYVHDEFDHVAFVRAMQGAQHASFAVTHYPHPFYDEAGGGLVVAGDFHSHRNVPNGAGRDVQVERLYVLDRSGGWGGAWDEPIREQGTLL